MERTIETQTENEPLSTADLANPRERQARPNNVSYQQEDGMGTLLSEDFIQEMRTQWDAIQTGFVDEPRSAVKQADELVAQAIKRLAENFASARNELEKQWDRGDNVSTEELRVALKKYRTFFHKLLAV